MVEIFICHKNLAVYHENAHQWTDINCHLHFHVLSGTNYKFMQLPIGGAYTKIMRKKLITEGVKMTHIGFVIINSHVTVIYLRFIKNTYFYAVKQQNLE